jgi:hypothetical protein
MARASKHGNNKTGPSLVRYWSQDHRTKNKERRIEKCNGTRFLTQWTKDLAAWKAKHK